MKVSDLVPNWPKTITLSIVTAFLFWGFACPSRVTSLVDPDKKITRPELQIELDALTATAEFRLASLEKQDAIRNIVFKNAMLMVETGSMNPAGIITMMLGIYGITRGAKDIKDQVKSKANNKK